MNWVYLVLSNSILGYGILILGWPLFPIIYLWWWEALLGSIMDRWLAKKNGVTELPERNLWLFGVYLIFILVLVGGIGSPPEQRFDNVATVFFGNPLFNLGLLLLVVYQGLRFYRNDVVEISAISFLQIRLHVGIVLGGLAIFIAQQTGWTMTPLFVSAFLLTKIVMDIVLGKGAGKEVNE